MYPFPEVARAFLIGGRKGAICGFIVGAIGQLQIYASNPEQYSIQDLHFLGESVLSAAIGIGAVVSYKLFLHFLRTPCFVSDRRLGGPTIVVHPFTSQKQLIPMIAHEYAHHLQYESSFPNVRSLKEGHARGIEKEISTSSSTEHTDASRFFHRYPRYLSELKSGYLFASKSASSLPCPEILALPFCVRRKEIYALGVTAFAVAQERHGVEIYRKALKGDFSFLGIESVTA